MVPGRACIACHTDKAPDADKTFWVAGTVFPTGREEDDCKGAAGSTGVRVEITDADGKTWSLVPNAAGNFALPVAGGQFPPYSTSTFKYPYTAVVKNGSASRAMGASQTSGDCNSCHSEPPSGGAPGRIVVPEWTP